MIRDCIKPVLDEELAKILSNKKFSIILDETTEISKLKCLAILVQFWDDNKSLTVMLHSITDCSLKQDAEGLYQVLNDRILSKPYSKNIIGYSSDGASVLRGKNNSVLQRLKQIYPKIWDIHCLPHCFNLICSFASKALIEPLVKSIYNHFAHSSLRIAKWSKLQSAMNLKPFKIVGLSATRWCSLFEVVDHILFRLNALIEYFKTNTDNKVKYEK